LRIGYVSADFRHHPVGRFLLPLFQNHDHRNFEIVCYADVARPDSLTEQLRQQADSWHDVRGFSDERLAVQIRQDRVDILIDLGAHMSRNRLLAFARKPAPVQVTYLAYCSTTGMKAIDYRLSDSQLDPDKDCDAHYSERTIRLPRTYWCYQPPADAPEVADASPMDGSGCVTFGCFNNFAKVSPPTIAAWARIMRAVANSRLIIHAHEGSHRQPVRDLLAANGVEPSRVGFQGLVPTREYLAQYSTIDIALDPFPYNGGTTTCDALWMGVPVVTLAGNTAVARAGKTLLLNVGLAELVAGSRDEYVDIAAKLAADAKRLRALRTTMRDRMSHSPLMDSAQFAAGVENAYRTIWRRWCES
jgi:predicted O-linked N-acetylglucosamine transferase (SPINDLY family)